MLPRRSARTAIATLCLAAQAWALAHLLVIRHEVCAEHGDAVHAADVVPEASHPPAAPGADPDASAYRGSQREAAEDHHDHCTWLSEHRADRGAPTALTTAPPIAGEALAAPAAPPSTVRALYRLAPKISPPRAA